MRVLALGYVTATMVRRTAEALAVAVAVLRFAHGPRILGHPATALPSNDSACLQRDRAGEGRLGQPHEPVL
jgi:hypothetical protein